MNFQRSLIGMAHLGPLPGTPCYGGDSVDSIVAQAVREACLLRDAGFHAVMLENMHDRPYQKGTVGPEIVAVMTLAAAAVKQACGLPTGIQVLAAANREAIAIAQAAGLEFVRVEGFVFAHAADEGIIESCAANLLRYRASLQAQSVKILADIKKKHAAHALTADVDVVETARAAEYFLADGLILTGIRTGVQADPESLQAVRSATRIPVLAGSGITEINVRTFLDVCDAVIVGSSIKHDGRWENPIDPVRADSLVRAASAPSP